MDNSLKTKYLHHTAAERASGPTTKSTPKTRINPPDSLRRGASQAATRLLRFATALRVTAPLGYGSRRLVWPKGSLSARPHGPTPPFSPREQYVSPGRPAAVQGAKRRSVPLTARTYLESCEARERGSAVEGIGQTGFEDARELRNGMALVNRTARHFRNIFAAAILALRP